MEQKFNQKVISYTKKVLLSKFGENWRRNEDFMKNAKILPLGGHPWGVGQKFYQTFTSYTKRVLMSKFGENRMKQKDFLKNAQNWPPEGTPEGGGAKNVLNIFL